MTEVFRFDERGRMYVHGQEVVLKDRPADWRMVDVAAKRPFRVKLVVPSGPDSHYFYAHTLGEAEQIRETLLREVPEPRNVFIYVDTTHGHVRVS